MGLRRARIAFLGALLVVAAIVLTACGGSEEDTRTGVPLPDDFPTEQVPLIDGNVLSATGTRKDGWSVTVQGPSNAGNQLDAAVKKLTGAGYAESQRTSDGGQSVVVLSAKKDSTTYWVQVGATPQAAAGGSSVFYLVNAS
ncbi:hypothetical protein GCM10009624_26520 [Gordonia sinesedis]